MFTAPDVNHEIKFQNLPLGPSNGDLNALGAYDVSIGNAENPRTVSPLDAGYSV